MKVKLLRDARIKHNAGEIVEVSPAECQFLTSTNSAVCVPETATEASPDATAAPKTTNRRKTTK